MASGPNPLPIFEWMNAYQKTMALKGAVELEIFTHIADGATSAAEIARRCNGTERGVRILCDFLTIHGLLTKTAGAHGTAGAYGLTPEAALFLSKRSRAYMGSAAMFLAHEHHVGHFKDVAAVVRKGGSLDDGNMGPDDPVWVEFARSMAELNGGVSRMIAPLVARTGHAMKVLDVAAGHGIFCIDVAKLNPAAEIFAVDWSNVLQVAIENAEAAGISNRFHPIAGSAFDVDLGSGYDLVLLPNFLHHFDPPTNVKLLQRIRAAMKADGVLATAEEVPNDDRVTPPIASFSMMMLCSTPAGDAYTFREFDAMFREAGFGETTARALEPSFLTLLLTRN